MNKKIKSKKGVSVIKRLARLKSLASIKKLHEQVRAGEFPCATGKTARRRNRAFATAFASHGVKLACGGKLKKIAA